jgi:hypothetical protein
MRLVLSDINSRHKDLLTNLLPAADDFDDYEEEGIEDRFLFASPIQIASLKPVISKDETDSRKIKDAEPKIRKLFPETWIFDSIANAR